MKFKQFWIYYLLTFLLLAFIPLLALVFNEGSLNFDEAAIRASEQTGISWTSNLIDVFRLSLAEPVLLLNVLGSAVPSLAAIVMLVFMKRKNKWASFFARLNPLRGTPWFEGLRIYGQIILILVLALFCVMLIRGWIGGQYPEPDFSQGFAIIPALITFALLDQGAVFEELGWRGFATPELQDGGMRPLKAALLIGLCWGLWHLPRDITTGLIPRLGFGSYLFLYLPSFVLGTVSVSVIAAYFMNRLGGSVIPAILIHGLANDAYGIAGKASIIEALTPYHQITQALPMALIAAGLLYMSGPDLLYKKAVD